MGKPNPGVVVLYWHRTDLRLHDSPALHAALDLNPAVFIPIWTWDPHYAYRSRAGPNRWKFLLECQRDLSESYRRLNPRQKLWVVREAPPSVLPKLWEQWGVTHLVFEKDTDAYARDRDESVERLAEEAGIEVIVRVGRTLFDPDELVRKNEWKPTMSMAQVRKAAERIGGNPEMPLPAPERIPDPWDEERMDLRAMEHDIVDDLEDLNRDHRTKDDTQYSALMGPNDDFGVPALEELGISSEKVTTPHQGGEREALQMLAKCIENKEYIGTFEKPNTSPAAFEPQSTTLLSPHLHFGSLSVRRFWWDVHTVLEERQKAYKLNSPIPVNLPGQLLFREMYFGAQAALGHSFAATDGNKAARFIDWHLRSGADWSGPQELQAKEWLSRWREGKTGFPWIDALMRQLKQEGWIHHLGRHSVACFLTRGGCYISWERGAEVFEELLLDHEPSCNIGNWMWLSCTAFFAQFHRCYSPIAFGKKWDPEGKLIRRYCPELAKFDKKYIYEPWKAPIQDQKRWGCRVVGEKSTQAEQVTDHTYPKPMFDFDQRRDICMDAMKHAYKVGMYGDDRRVLDGSWKEEFGDEREPPTKRRKK